MSRFDFFSNLDVTYPIFGVQKRRVTHKYRMYSITKNRDYLSITYAFRKICTRSNALHCAQYWVLIILYF